MIFWAWAHHSCVMTENTLAAFVSCTCLNIYMPVWTVCFHQGCVLFSQLPLFSAKLFFLPFSDRLFLVGVFSYCLVCMVLSGRLAPVFLLICCGGLWQLISPEEFSPGIFFSTPWWIFHFSLPPLLTPCSNVVSISLYPFIFCQSLSPSYLSFVLLVASSLPAPEPLPLNVFFQFHILPLLFYSQLFPPFLPPTFVPLHLTFF